MRSTISIQSWQPSPSRVLVGRHRAVAHDLDVVDDLNGRQSAGAVPSSLSVSVMLVPVWQIQPVTVGVPLNVVIAAIVLGIPQVPPS